MAPVDGLVLVSGGSIFFLFSNFSINLRAPRGADNLAKSPVAQW